MAEQKRPEDVRTPAGGAGGSRPVTKQVEEMRKNPDELPKEGSVDRHYPQQQRDPDPAKTK